MVSVIIPNYNHAPYLRKRIDSVLAQSYRDFELIILDDKSTDNSRDIIEEYSNCSKVSHIVYNEKNSGSTFKQWNKGIALAKGEYIWIAESDDVAEITLLETLMKGFNDNPECFLSYCDLYEIDSTDRIIGNWRYTYADKLDLNCLKSSFVMNGAEYIQKFISIENTIPNASAVVFSKQAFLKVGGADEDIKYCSDWLLWLKLLNEGDLYHSNKRLNLFRTHHSSVIASVWNDPKNAFLKKYTIIMWQRYLSYLKCLNKPVPLLIKIARNTIAIDSMIEFFFLLRKKEYKRSMKYIQMATCYSRNPLYAFKYIIYKLR